MTALETLAVRWADIMDKVTGSFEPTVERLPDDRILFSVHCGDKKGSGKVTIQLAVTEEDVSLPMYLDIVSDLVRESVTAACPYSRRFL